LSETERGGDVLREKKELVNLFGKKRRFRQDSVETTQGSSSERGRRLHKKLKER